MIVQYTCGSSTVQMDSIVQCHTSCTAVQAGDQDRRQRRTETSPAQQGSKTLPAMASTAHFNSGRTHSTCTYIRQHRPHSGCHDRPHSGCHDRPHSGCHDRPHSGCHDRPHSGCHDRPHSGCHDREQSRQHRLCCCTRRQLLTPTPQLIMCLGQEAAASLAGGKTSRAGLPTPRDLSKDLQANHDQLQHML
jgi:hypothetical protein